MENRKDTADSIIQSSLEQDQSVPFWFEDWTYQEKKLDIGGRSTHMKGHNTQKSVSTKQNIHENYLQKYQLSIN